MKIRKLVMIMAMGLTVSLCGCGGEKVIGGDSNQTGENVQNQGNEQAGNTGDGEQQGSTQNTRGYVFACQGMNIAVDGDISNYLDTLGEPASYFEAASCAFDGLDKVYTYASFVIKTYPQGKQDLISDIILMDDSVATPEGIYIGSPAADVYAAYGNNYTQNGNMAVYEKDSMKLGFIIENDEVTSIQYSSTVLDE